MSSPTEADRLARVALTRACEPGDPTTASLVDQLGPQGRAGTHQSGLTARLAGAAGGAALTRTDKLLLHRAYAGGGSGEGSSLSVRPVPEPALRAGRACPLSPSLPHKGGGRHRPNLRAAAAD